MSSNCSTCKPISDGGYIRPVTGQGHVVTNVETTQQDTGGSQWWQEYKLTLDDPITEKGADAVDNPNT